MDVGGCFFGFVVMEGHLWITTSKPTNYGRGNTRKAEQKKHTQKRGRMAHTTLSSNQHVDAGLESGCLKHCEARAGRSDSTSDIAIDLFYSIEQ